MENCDGTHQGIILQGTYSDKSGTTVNQVLVCSKCGKVLHELEVAKLE